MRFDTQSRNKPLLKWAGGKSGPLNQLLPLFPRTFERYLEPFAGGCAVFLALDPAIPAVLNDCNPELVELYQVVRDAPDELAHALDGLAAQYDEAFYYALRKKVPNDPLARAARTLFLNKTGFNGLYRLNSKGDFNVPFGKRAKCPTLYDRENLLAISRRLANVELLCEDFEQVLEKAGTGDFVYCDPPYEPLSPTSAFTAYTRNGFGQADQRRLEAACSAAASRGAQVAVSNSEAGFIRELYAAWKLAPIRAKRAINSKGGSRGEIVELFAARGYEPGPAST